MQERKLPHLKHLHLYRKGLHIEPDENFINKFVEIYNDLIASRKDLKGRDINYETAKYFIICACESIIHSLDFGFDIWLKRVMVFTQKISDYKLNAPTKKSGTQENVRKITFRPIVSMILKIKKILNKDNERYQQFIKDKKERHQKIKEYYREFYGEEDWWQ